MSQLKPRSGFTLVELLVVIAIIGVLIALLLPAVQQAREAARRMQCTNHQKQLALAIHNYHDTFQVFPPGQFVNVNGASSTLNLSRFCWMQTILPFIEQTALHDQFQQQINAGTTEPWNWTGRDTVVDGFLCPSAPGGAKVNTRGFHGNYVTVHGDHFVKHQVDDDQANGMFYVKSKLSFRDVTDGTSNVAMISKILVFNGNNTDRRGAYFMTSFNSANVTVAFKDGPNTSVPDAGNSATLVDNPPSMPAVNSTEYVGMNARSQHPGGVLAARVDGSVRFIPETIDLTTYRRFGARNDGQPLGEF